MLIDLIVGNFHYGTKDEDEDEDEDEKEDEEEDEEEEDDDVDVTGTELAALLVRCVRDLHGLRKAAMDIAGQPWS